MAGLLEGVQQVASSSWDTVTGGLERWVGIEVNEELDQLGDNTADDGSAQPDDGYRTTGQAPADDGSPNPAGQNGGGGLQKAAAFAGIAAAGVTLFRFLR